MVAKKYWMISEYQLLHVYEQLRERIPLIICELSEDSDQPAFLRSRRSDYSLGAHWNNLLGAHWIA